MSDGSDDRLCARMDMDVLNNNFDRLAFMAVVALADTGRVRPLPFWSLFRFFITSLLK
jgi:hypothetical protein